ncbi:MAG: hypothetical protein JW860_04205 [Sedimentisphaerales bacterium]|nr:hypothetical protein [Sedimentisphaerales bacterium]
MNRWLWYINALILFTSVIVVVFGLSMSSEYIPISAKKGNVNSRGESGQPNDSQTESLYDISHDSNFVNAIRTYAKRWGPAQGYIEVTITPPQVVEAGAKWNLNGKKWLNSGTRIKVNAGDHIVNFQTISKWINPPLKKITVTKSHTTQIIAEYMPPEYASLTVEIIPAEVRDLGGQWKVDDKPWQDSGQKIDQILVGKKKLQFKPVPGWKIPTHPAVELTKDQLETVTAEYTLCQYGSVLVTIEPEEVVGKGAQWRIKNGSWNDNDTRQEQVEVGTYTIEFKPVEGWTPPKDLIVNVSQDSLITGMGKYIVPKPPVPNFILTGTMVIGSEDGMAWVKLPKEVKDKGFFVGEKIDTYTLTEVNDGSVILMKDGYDFTLQMKEPPPPSPGRAPARPPEKRPTTRRERPTPRTRLPRER